MRKPRRVYTEAEDARIREEYGKDRVDLTALAIELDRDKTSVCRRARSLGLTKGSRKVEEAQPVDAA